MIKKVKNELKGKINKFRKNHNWKKKYNELLNDYEKVIFENMNKEKEIDSLNFKLENDFQAKKIDDLEYVNKHYRETIHKLREEIIELKQKIARK